MSEIEYNNFMEHNKGCISSATSELETIIINIDNLSQKVESESENCNEKKRILSKLEIQKTRVSNAIDKLASI